MPQLQRRSRHFVEGSQTAVVAAPRPRIVLLVEVFCHPEVLGRLQDFGADLLGAGAVRIVDQFLHFRLALLSNLFLLLVVVVNAGPILRPSVTPLLIQRCWVVLRPKRLHDIVEREYAWVVHDTANLGVVGHTTANLLVRRVSRHAARVSHLRRKNSFPLHEQVFHAPEAAHPDKCRLVFLVEWAVEGGSFDEVRGCSRRRLRNRRVTAWDAHTLG
mmetsp:Transcript_11024/g.26974  ORF Transcript_11024/g.26974 Transcript_11024/m.26974 type:complete len:216 (+) Transcript_11024:926-1573(+)